MARALTDIRSLARVHTASAVRTLVAIMRQPKAPAAARVSAACALLDRGWGKPKETVEQQHSVSDTVLELLRAIGQGKFRGQEAELLEGIVEPAKLKCLSSREDRT